MLIMTEETMTLDNAPYFEEFRCLNCDWYLGAVIEHEGRTALRLLLPGIKALVFKAEIECKMCHETREFHSGPMSETKIRKWIEGRKR